MACWLVTRETCLDLTNLLFWLLISKFLKFSSFFFFTFLIFYFYLVNVLAHLYFHFVCFFVLFIWFPLPAHHTNDSSTPFCVCIHLLPDHPHPSTQYSLICFVYLLSFSFLLSLNLHLVLDQRSKTKSFIIIQVYFLFIFFTPSKKPLFFKFSSFIIELLSWFSKLISPASCQWSLGLSWIFDLFQSLIVPELLYFFLRKQN